MSAVKFPLLQMNKTVRTTHFFSLFILLKTTCIVGLQLTNSEDRNPLAFHDAVTVDHLWIEFKGHA